MHNMVYKCPTWFTNAQRGLQMRANLLSDLWWCFCGLACSPATSGALHFPLSCEASALLHGLRAITTKDYRCVVEVLLVTGSVAGSYYRCCGAAVAHLASFLLFATFTHNPFGALALFLATQVCWMSLSLVLVVIYPHFAGLPHRRYVEPVRMFRLTWCSFNSFLVLLLDFLFGFLLICPDVGTPTKEFISPGLGIQLSLAATLLQYLAIEDE